MPKKQPFTDDDRSELVAYLDGELVGDAQRRIENRLITDPTVRAEADSLKRAWDLLDVLPRPEPSTDFTERTMDRVSAVVVPSRKTTCPVAEGWNRRTLVAIASWSAAALLAAVLGFILMPRPRPASSADMDLVNDKLMVREPTVIENLPLYLAAENLDYLLALDQSDLFADDGVAR
jgi:anti-sigma factor RsiW